MMMMIWNKEEFPEEWKEYLSTRRAIKQIV
jgi:hypothetical protein